jgi:hypothetical protein
MELLDLLNLSNIREPGADPKPSKVGSASLDDQERNKLRRFDSLWEAGAELTESMLSNCRPNPSPASAGEAVVGVDALVGDGAGGFGRGALERRRLVLLENPGLRRPEEVGLPVFGFDSLWVVLRGASLDWALPMVARLWVTTSEVATAYPYRRQPGPHAWI